MTDTKKEYNIDFERVVELISKYKQIKKSGAIKNYTMCIIISIICVFMDPKRQEAKYSITPLHH